MAKRQLKTRKMTVTNRRRAQSMVHQPLIIPIDFKMVDSDIIPKPMLAELIEVNAHQSA
ncbi:MAG TPA: hypothetical protein VFM46_14880 [Pseudomonadales bacterium]|nr:hypothetical protein [Pseudomonadales bacterium]